MADARARTLSMVALGCGVVAVLSAALFLAFWLLLPGVLFSIAAIVCGAIARRKGGPSEMATIGITLGIVAILLVPTVVLVWDAGHNDGRDCALNPHWEDC